MTNVQNKRLLQVENLSIGFSQYVKGTQRRMIQPITDMHVDIDEGEIVAVVGASGSGKSLLAHAVLGILPGNAISSGSILYQGEELTQRERNSSGAGRSHSFHSPSIILILLCESGSRYRSGWIRQPHRLSKKSYSQGMT